MNVKAVGNNAKEIVENMMSSKFFKTIIPADMNKELADYAANNARFQGQMARDAVQETLTKQHIEVTDDIQKVLKKIKADNIDEGVEGLRDLIPEGKNADAILKRAKTKASGSIENIDKEQIIQKMGPIDRVMNYPGAYFNNPDKKVRNTRIAAAAGAYAGVAVGGRYLSGGTLTTDNYGRQDIAGIPFI